MGSLKEERKTTGWAARDPSGVLSPYTFTLRNTGAEDVLIKVICCGVCHTDLHQIKNDLGMSNYPMACRNSLAVKAERWSESSHRFVKRCSDSGNAEASYILGMIRFYCLQNRGSGASLMAKAAIRSHAPALYSLAVIQFNGSGGKKNDRDLRAGVALCARAAFLGHIDALRELGHCLQDGYGINKNIPAGRRLLIQANTRELAGVLPTTQNHLRFLPFPGKQIFHRNPQIAGPLLSDFGCNVPAPDTTMHHPFTIKPLSPSPSTILVHHLQPSPPWPPPPPYLYHPPLVCRERELERKSFMKERYERDRKEYKNG